VCIFKAEEREVMLDVIDYLVFTKGYRYQKFSVKDGYISLPTKRKKKEGSHETVTGVGTRGTKNSRLQLRQEKNKEGSTCLVQVQRRPETKLRIIRIAKKQGLKLQRFERFCRWVS